jgi:glycosyltransferase involved in cell wall biosynthesis
VIIAYWVHPEGLGAVRAGSALGVPVIVVALGSDLRVIPDALARRGVRQALRNAAYVMTVSGDLRDHAIALGAAPERTRTVLNGCDREVFHPQSRPAAREELGVAADARLVLYVGRLAAVKGPLELLDALARLRVAEPRVQLAVIGQGELEGQARERASAPDLAGVVRWEGSLEPARVARWMAAADVLCLPSHSEGCPNVVLEALLCGRPVVASKVGGVPEMVDASCAVLVPPGDREALAQGLGEGLSRKWSEADIAGRRIRTWDDVGRDTFEVCQAVLAGTRA